MFWTAIAYGGDWKLLRRSCPFCPLLIEPNQTDVSDLPLRPKQEAEKFW